MRSDVGLRLVPPGSRRLLDVFNCVVGVVFCSGLAFYGWQIVETGWLLDERSSSGLKFPMWLDYAALPAGAASMAISYVVRLAYVVWRYDPATMAVAHVAAHELPLDAAPRIEA